MNQKTLKYTICGKDEDNNYVRLSDLIVGLSEINTTLNNINRSVSKEFKPTNYYRIISLSQQSPATIEIEAIPYKNKQDYSTVIIDKFINGLEEIQHGSIPKEFDWNIINSYSKIGQRLKKNVGHITISVGEKVIELNKDVETMVKNIIGEDEIEKDAVSGILEALNIHGGKNKFIIYPIVGAKKIDCIFPNTLIDDAILAIKKYIELKGVVRYRKNAKFPYMINVEELEIYPDEDELPDLFDLEGISPNVTGDLSVEEFIESIRHED